MVKRLTGLLFDDDEPAPVDAYARSKCLAEEALWEVSWETALEVVIIRPPLVYGAGMKGNMLSLARGIRNHLPFTPGGPSIIDAHWWVFIIQ